jgi:hypothetical protein
MIKDYSQYTNSDLKKFYLFAHSDRFSFSHIDSLVRSVSAELFQLLMPPGIFPKSIDPEIPIFNYGNKPELQKLIDDGIVKKKNVYNLPENLINANSKVEFHKKTKDLKFVPKSVFTKKAAMDLKFPIIAKPAGGSKGEGIEVFKTKEDLEKSDAKLDVFSEKFDLKREFRVISIKGELVFIAERIPENDKANSLREGKDIFDREGTLSERSSYKWVKVQYGRGEIPEKEKFQKICKAINDALKLEFLGVDIGLDGDGKLWCIEANTCPGLNKDQIVLIYLALFKDFYGREPNEHTMKKIKHYKKELMRANKDSAKFSFSPHQGNRFYYYDDKVDMETGERHGRSLLTTKYNIEKSLGDTMLNIKKAHESKVMNFQDFLNEQMDEKKELPKLGDSMIDILKLDVKDLIAGKLKPTLVEPNDGKDKTRLFIEDIHDMEDGSKSEEITIYLKEPLYVNFTWSWDYKAGMKGDGHINPDDPDEYTLAGINIDSVYYDEDAVEVDRELSDLLKKYLEEYLPTEK